MRSLPLVYVEDMIQAHPMLTEGTMEADEDVDKMAIDETKGQ